MKPAETIRVKSPALGTTPRRYMKIVEIRVQTLSFLDSAIRWSGYFNSGNTAGIHRKGRQAGYKASMDALVNVKVKFNL